MQLICAVEGQGHGVCDEVPVAAGVDALAGLDVDGDGLDDVVFIGTDEPTVLFVLPSKP